MKQTVNRRTEFSPAGSSSLEARARGLVGRLDMQSWEVSPVSTLEREIALTLHELEQTRALHDTVSRSITKSQCDANTELMQMEARTPRYSLYRFPEREKLQRRQLRIEQERRNLVLAEERELRALRRQLLSLLEQHAQLAG